MDHLLLTAKGGFAEIQKDPALAIAATLLIVVSVLWIIGARLITVQLKRNARRRARARGKKPKVADREIWKAPP